MNICRREDSTRIRPRFPPISSTALGALFVLVAAWPVARRLGIAYAVFIVINILPPLAAGGFLSAGRFSAVLFPAFVWFASAVPERHRAGLARKLHGGAGVQRHVVLHVAPPV